MDLMKKVVEGKAVVGIVGLGYVGLPLAVAFARKGFKVIGFDTDRAKVESLKLSKTYIKHIPDSVIAEINSLGFEPTSDFSRARECDALLLCVPTPLTRHREPDLSFIVRSCEALLPNLRAGQLIVLESTTYPGTTEEVVKPILERSGLKVGHDLFLGYSPEREDPNNPDFDTARIPKVIGADDPASLEAMKALYSQVVVKVVPVSSTKVAEASKILENTFRAVNIALVNELKMVFHRMGIDIWEVIDAASTKPFGFMRFEPGPGLGGHCIPIDPFYLTWKAREYDMGTRFIETAGEINRSMPHFVVTQTMEALSNQGRGLKGARVLVVGLAYKKNVDDARESPAFKIIELLEARGAKVDYHDPYIPVIPVTRDHPHLAGRQSVSLAKAKDYDVVIIVTNHDNIDWGRLLEDAHLIVDTRGVYRGPNPKVVKA